MKQIPLTRNKIALVDDEDFEYLNQWNWIAFKSKKDKWYALRVEGGTKQRSVLMHRQIMDTPLGMQTDHIDNNGLNNQRYNLRICTNGQNMANVGLLKSNTSGYKGVSKLKGINKWQSNITVNGKQIWLKIYDTPEMAAKVYDEAAKKYFGEFARLNFPD